MEVCGHVAVVLIALSCVSQLRQRTVSQQTSFDAPGLRSPAGRVRTSSCVLCGAGRWQLTCVNIVQVTLSAFAQQGEPESPSFRRTAGPLHRRHVRTIQEVRTTTTRIITDVYYEDGKEVERKVTEVTNRFLVQLSVAEE